MGVWPPALVPTLEVAGPTGQRVLVAPRSLDDKVGDLADALGVDGGSRTRPRRPTRHPSRGARSGRGRARQHARSRRVLRPAARPTTRWCVAVCEAGPAAGLTTPLAARPARRRPLAARPRSGSTTPGSRSTTPCSTSPTTARPRVTQLTGRVAVPDRWGADPRARRTCRSAVSSTLGASRLRLVAAERTAGSTGGARRRSPTIRGAGRCVAHHAPCRAGRPIRSPCPTRQPPPSRPGVAGLAAAVLDRTRRGRRLPRDGLADVPDHRRRRARGVGGDLGGVGDLGGTGRRGGRGPGTPPTSSAFAAAVDAQRSDRVRHHRATTPSVTEAVRAAVALSAGVWARRSGSRRPPPAVHRMGHRRVGGRSRRHRRSPRTWPPSSPPRRRWTTCPCRSSSGPARRWPSAVSTRQRSPAR